MKLLPFLTKPRTVQRTGDDTAASTLMSYVWRMSGKHQIAICLIAVVMTLINLGPIELQRRIVNEVVDTQDVSKLVQFMFAYIALILTHQFIKFGLRLYQGWVEESTKIYTRQHLLGIYGKKQDDVTEDESGRVVSIVNSEVESLGGFVGDAISQAFANAAMLIGVVAYMFVVQPSIAAFALAALVPQVILTPFIQRRLNELVSERVEYLRQLGDEISDIENSDKDSCLAVLPKIFENRMLFVLLKNLMKTILNLLNSAGPIIVLFYGGYLVIQGETQVGVIVAFLSGFERMSSPVRELISFYRLAAQAGVQHGKIAEWMNDKK